MTAANFSQGCYNYRQTKCRKINVDEPSDRTEDRDYIE